MSNIVIVGTQWGDEGKGKIVDLLAPEIAAIVRFQGGNNAGHTVIANGNKYVLHLIPSGVLHEGKICVIGNGVVVDPEVLCREIDALAEQGVAVTPANLKISYKAHIIMPYHKALDAAREANASEGKIGTTGRGIGPCYEDRANRMGVRACDLLDIPLLYSKVRKALAEKNVLLQHRYSAAPLSANSIMAELEVVAAKLAPYLADTSEVITQCQAQGGRILFEGAQGVHLDIDHGTYPYVTSSNTVAGNAAAGSGVPPSTLGRVIGITKAYTTRVGAGPFPSELTDTTGDYLQEKGFEFGATTGRRRRCGWLDMVVLRETHRLCGLTDIALTKIDVLSGLDSIKICTHYMMNGKEIMYPPQREDGLAHVAPVYETLPGWNEPIDQARTWEELPEAARQYITRIEELSGVRVSVISVGPDRDQTIRR